MATYLEVETLMDNIDLKKKVKTALCIAAYTYLANTPSVNEEKWSGVVLEDPNNGETRKALRYLIAKNNAATVANIIGASDSVIQTDVDGVTGSLVKDFAVNG